MILHYLGNAIRWLVLPALVLLLFTLPRQLELDRYVTADEPMFIRESGNFLVALSQGSYEETNRVYQPGVTTLWMGALAYYRLFPEYAYKGELDSSDLQLSAKLINADLKLLQLLILGRLHMLRLLAVAALVGFLYARQLVGIWPALLGFGLIAFDPFLFAHSRLLATDAPLAMFALACLLALLYYQKTREILHLLVAGACAGLAVLSKVTGLFLLPFAAILLLADSLRPPISWSQVARRTILPLALMAAVTLVTVVALWPALWTQPARIVSELSWFTFQSAEGIKSSNTFFQGEMIPGGDLGGLRFAHFYPLTFLWRTTPVVLIGLAGFLLRTPASSVQASDYRRTAAWLAVFALLFTLFMTLSSKKFDRYLLPVYPAVGLLAGMGWMRIAAVLQARRPASAWRIAWVGLLALAFAGQVVFTVMAAPYPISYYNPLLGGTPAAAHTMLTGWGEGLDEAAEYINRQPGAKDLEVYSWYAAVFNMYFEGTADDLPISDAIDDSKFKSMLEADYAVIYHHQWQRQPANRLLRYLADKPYVYAVRVNGAEYVRVYDLRQIGAEQDLTALPAPASREIGLRAVR